MITLNSLTDQYNSIDVATALRDCPTFKYIVDSLDEYLVDKDQMAACGYIIFKWTQELQNMVNYELWEVGIIEADDNMEIMHDYDCMGLFAKYLSDAMDSGNPAIPNVMAVNSAVVESDEVLYLEVDLFYMNEEEYLMTLVVSKLQEGIIGVYDTDEFDKDDNYKLMN